jgi:acetolactate synthase-1/2/3 large subunit
MTQPNGGAPLAETLARLRVKHVFALRAGHLDAFLVACPDVGIRLIDMRHEATAGHAADAYARATGGSIGVAVITAGPGFTNALTPMTSAYVDAIPVLFVAGSPPLREAEANPLQGGFDQVAMAAPVTNWAHRVTNAERIPDIIEKGFRIASTGRPGPVFIDIPIDVMFMPAKNVMIPIERAPVAFDRPVPSPETIAALLKLLRDAKRPVIIAGGGTILSPTAAPLKAFVEASGIPVATNVMAHGVLSADHPMYVGGVGAIGATAARQKLVPDLVVLAGARAGMNTGAQRGGDSARGKGRADRHRRRRDRPLARCRHGDCRRLCRHVWRACRSCAGSTVGGLPELESNVAFEPRAVRRLVRRCAKGNAARRSASLSRCQSRDGCARSRNRHRRRWR